MSITFRQTYRYSEVHEGMCSVSLEGSGCEQMSAGASDSQLSQHRGVLPNQVVCVARPAANTHK